MNKKPFDFGAFIASTTNPDPEVRKEILRAAVGDEMETVMGELAPRLWCVMQEAMATDPKSDIHLNACMNASIFAVLGWVVACTPEGAKDDKDNDAVLREKIIASLDNALKNGRNDGRMMATIGNSVGKLKLMEDAMSGMGKIVTTNSSIINGIGTLIKNMTPKK